MIDNVLDINDARLIKNILRDIKVFESQLSDLKKATMILAKHTESQYSDRFYNIMCHELVGKQKEVAQELLKLRVRLDKYKNGVPRE